MKPILAVLTVVGLGLLLIGVLLFQLRDGTVFTSPPEAVVENFTRALATHRYSQALKYLDEDLRSRTAVDDLKRLTAALEFRVGKIHSVRGEPVLVAENDAEAMAFMTTTRTFHTARFALSRKSGVWRIDSMSF